MILITKKILLLLFLSSSLCIYSETSQDSLFFVLEKELDKKEIYMAQKEQHIDDIKKMRTLINISEDQIYEINLKLYNEYKTYISDSAIYYIQNSLQMARQINDPDRIYESQLYLASLYAQTGMYIDSYNTLMSIKKDKLPEKLLVNYYGIYKQLYSNYSVGNIKSTENKKISNLYRDSLLSTLDTESNHYKIVYAEKLVDLGKLDEANQILQNLFNSSTSVDHEYAVVAYAIASIYRDRKDVENQKKYYTLSAIADTRNAIKENASFLALATVLYETGDIENAYKCMQESMKDAMFCNARQRTFEVSNVFPIIDSAYQERVIKQKEGLQLFLVVTSILSVFLILAVVYIYRQMKKTSYTRKELYHTNLKLNELNEDLHKVNNKLKAINQDLSEANRIKETYIGHFLDLCSTYIDKLEKYQNTLNKKAVEKKLDELYKMLKSPDMVNNELKELYENFDNIFLHLYPNFVEDFNSLLVDKERFEVKANELNIELRIFALIRLGITDSSKIANFLHYSANTIYNYRARVRNKAAVPREEFEYLVCKIGVISH